jgi:hypothetical protein
MTHENSRIERIRWWFLVLVITVVLAGAAVPLAVTTWLDHRVDLAQFDINCSNATYNRQMLERLNRLSNSLGIPPESIPPLPEECNDR